LNLNRREILRCVQNDKKIEVFRSLLALEMPA
jgi:hypothetical protein